MFTVHFLRLNLDIILAEEIFKSPIYQSFPHLNVLLGKSISLKCSWTLWQFSKSESWSREDFVLEMTTWCDFFFSRSFIKHVEQFQKEAVPWFLALFLEDIKCCLEPLESLNWCLVCYFSCEKWRCIGGSFSVFEASSLLIIVIIISAQSHETLQWIMMYRYKSINDG